MKILAIHLHTHDASVVATEGSHIAYAASNERFSRIKMDKGIPIRALENYLDFTKTSPDQINELVFVGSRFPVGYWKFLKENTAWLVDTKGRYLDIMFPHLDKLVLELVLLTAFPRYLLREIYPRTVIKNYLRGFKGKVSFVHHHSAHLYSAYFGSGWHDCLVVAMEGSGFKESFSIFEVKGGIWKKVCQSQHPHSAGVFYGVATTLLGFKAYKHAGKVTGLAGYGDPTKLARVVDRLMWVEKMNLKVDSYKLIKWLKEYEYGQKIPPELQGFSREDIAAAFQKRLEDCILKIVSEALRISRCSRVAISGGVAANVRLNQKIHELNGVKEVFIQPAMGDDGLALGAAYYAAFENNIKIEKLENLYLGPDYSDTKVLEALRKYQVRHRVYKDIEGIAARLLSQGKIVARYAGRMEMGPRALGNRSILCQATDPSTNDWLNKRLKRSEFMPFAPVTLKEYAHLCYKGLKGAEFSAKFMTITFNCTPYMRKTSPAVVHIDGTARPQIITRQDNPGYYKILKEYHRLTGIPSLVNTSFNMHEEPIVCTPEDAIRSYLASGLDYLLINNYLVTAK